MIAGGPIRSARPARGACVAALLVLCSACAPERVFVCVASEQCDGPGAPGFCQPSHQCSQPDASCPSGQRFVEHAASALRGQCVAGDLISDLVGRWGFDEGSGAITRDLSGRGADGVLLNDPQWTDGRWGSALRFDGHKSRVQGGDPVTRFGRASFSAFAWVRSADVRSLQARVFGWWWKPYDAYLFLNFAKGLPFVESVDSTRVHWGAGAKGASIADGLWHHVGFVCDRQAGTVLLYVDGMVRGMGRGIVSDGFFGDDASTGGNILIGSQAERDDLSLEGTIDEVWVHARALQDIEVQALYGGASVNPR